MKFHIDWGGERKALYKGVAFCCRHVLKTSRGSLKGKAQREQYLLTVGLGRYKWYQSQTSGDVPARRLFPEGGRHEAKCQTGRWAPKGVDLVVVPYRLEKETSASEDIGPQRGGGVDCEIPYRLGRITKHPL